MALDSPRIIYKNGFCVVRPQPLSDRTYVNRFVDFINDVVPQAYTGNPRQDDKDRVVWVKFLDCDVNSTLGGVDCEGTLLLCVGYTNGIQLWLLPSNGEALEILSLRQGPVRSFLILPTPKQTNEISAEFVDKLPLVAVCDGASVPPYCSVVFTSVRTGEKVHSITFKKPVIDILANTSVVVISLHEKVAVFNSATLKPKFTVISCYPSEGYNRNPLALGGTWLAYADKKLVSCHQSNGGMSGDGAQSYTATVINTIGKGFSMFGETVTRLTSATGSSISSSSTCNTDTPTDPTSNTQTTLSHDELVRGVVTIVDIHSVRGQQFTVTDDSSCEGLVAHFPAHCNQSIAALQFDRQGSLIVTAGCLGHDFNVFHMITHPWSGAQTAIHHLYTLHRGDTTAKVQDITFTVDSRWVAVTTLKGTTHVFAITPYGGPVSSRTHVSRRVVNRESRYYRSAGLSEIDVKPHQHSPSRNSPQSSVRTCSHLSTSVPNTVSSSPGSGGHRSDSPPLHSNHSTPFSTRNPRLPPYPQPITIYPLVQLKQPVTLATITTSPLSPCVAANNHRGVESPSKLVDIVCVATARFSASRGRVIGSGYRDPLDSSVAGIGVGKMMDSLFICGQGGILEEYVLEPLPIATATLTNGRGEERALGLSTHPRSQWALQRSVTMSELLIPLSDNNPLILSCNAILRPLTVMVTRCDSSDGDGSDDDWVSQVEMLTHASPHRRLWMGPQFTFKTFHSNEATATVILSSSSSSLLSQSRDVQTLDMCPDDLDLSSLRTQPVRSDPVPVPQPCYPTQNVEQPSSIPLYIEAGSGSFDRLPGLLQVYEEGQSSSGWTNATTINNTTVGDDVSTLTDERRGFHVRGEREREARWTMSDDIIPASVITNEDIISGLLRDNIADAMLDSTDPTGVSDSPRGSRVISSRGSQPRTIVGQPDRMIGEHVVIGEVYSSGGSSSSNSSSVPRILNFDPRNSPLSHHRVLPSSYSSPESS